MILQALVRMELHNELSSSKAVELDGKIDTNIDENEGNSSMVELINVLSNDANLSTDNPRLVQNIRILSTLVS